MKINTKALSLVTLVAFSLLGGCAVTQPQNTPVERWLERDPRTGRTFYLYVPSTYSYTKAMPVIVSCHGTPPFDVHSHHIDEWKALGEKYGCIILSPALIGTDGILGDGPVSSMMQTSDIFSACLA